MKVFVLALLVAAICVTIDSAPAAATIELAKYDNFNIDEILDNQRILKNYIKCMLDKGPCTPEGKDFRRFLPETLEDSCRGCSASQRQRMRQITTHLRNKRPDDWTLLLAKYDPQGKYKVEFDKFVNSTD
ncbi:ejaculatory bulb-specific protein 3-like [Arctopsyche grandis]|uniref:ejaculatory bulb-specific protein 3-like n=1 Tax=Arctopsyche grandis TaxID=121162 RepID=UPI00406D77AE